MSEVDRGNWTSLLQCDLCRSRWMDVPYEPYGQFHYLVRWDGSVTLWRAARDLDADASTLHDWHSVRCGELIPDLIEESDIKAIGWHRERSYGRDPRAELDRMPRAAPDLRQATGVDE